LFVKNPFFLKKASITTT